MRRSTDLPPQAPSRRITGRAVLIALGAVVFFLLLFGRAMAGFYVDFLWHQGVGRTDVFWGRLGAQFTLFGIFFGTFVLVAGLNLFLADRLAPTTFPANVHPYVERFRRELAVLRAEDASQAPAPAMFYDIGEVSRAYAMPRKGLFGKREMKTALHPTTLTIGAGERVGIVGVSGSGKTTLLRLMLALDTTDTGAVTCEGKEIFPAEVRKLKWYRRKVQYVPQDPASTLDPLMTVAKLVREPLVRLGVAGDHDEMVREALDSVGLDETFMHRRANELSGGQAQRLAIARAIATRPDFLLADEPVSGLDLPMREAIVALLRKISEERGTGIVVVSHDLSMVASLCERTVVMHGGEIVEDRSTKQVLTDPRHERTKELLDAIPTLHVMPADLQIA